MQISTIGLDIAKNVFQVHGIDAAEKVVVRKRLRRRQVLEFFKTLPPCLIGMEACATAHYYSGVPRPLGGVFLLRTSSLRRLRGWGDRTRTQESVRQPCN
jgi:transposase